MPVFSVPNRWEPSSQVSDFLHVWWNLQLSNVASSNVMHLWCKNAHLIQFNPYHHNKDLADKFTRYCFFFPRELSRIAKCTKYFFYFPNQMQGFIFSARVICKFAPEIPSPCKLLLAAVQSAKYYLARIKLQTAPTK